MLKPPKGATSKAVKAEPLLTKVALKGCNCAGCGYRFRGSGLVFCVWGLGGWMTVRVQGLRSPCMVRPNMGVSKTYPHRTLHRESVRSPLLTRTLPKP